MYSLFDIGRSTDHHRKTPSPTHQQSNAPVRPTYAAHKRRDSDTLRSSYPQAPSSNSPTIVDQYAVPARHSPSAKGLVPSTSLDGNNKLYTANAAKHRRSPTAPDPPTTSGTLNNGNTGAPMRTHWVAADRNSGEGYPSDRERDRGRDKERDRDRERSRGPPADVQRQNQYQPQTQPRTQQPSDPVYQESASSPPSSNSPSSSSEEKRYNITVIKLPPRYSFSLTHIYNR